VNSIDNQEYERGREELSSGLRKVEGVMNTVCFPFLFFLITSVITLTPEPMLQLNVCLLGWVIDSNTVRSVSCVSLSFPESTNRWDRWKEPPAGTGSNLWRGPGVPVLSSGLAQRCTAGRSDPTDRSSPYTVIMSYFYVGGFDFFVKE